MKSVYTQALRDTSIQLGHTWQDSSLQLQRAFLLSDEGKIHIRLDHGPKMWYKEENLSRSLEAGFFYDFEWSLLSRAHPRHKFNIQLSWENRPKSHRNRRRRCRKLSLLLQDYQIDMPTKGTNSSPPSISMNQRWKKQEQSETSAPIGYYHFYVLVTTLCMSTSKRLVVALPLASSNISKLMRWHWKLGNSSILGILQDAHLNANQYNWLSSIFYFGYLLAEWPQNWALQRFPVAKWLTANLIAWWVFPWPCDDWITHVPIFRGGILLLQISLPKFC